MNHSYCLQQRRQLLGFTRLLSSYGCSGPGDTTCDACGPCEARLWLEAHNVYRPAPLPKLAPREAEVLLDIPSGDDWWRPMDCGGRDGSDHSRVLMKLAEKGYVEMKEWGGHCRGSWRYRRIAS